MAKDTKEKIFFLSSKTVIFILTIYSIFYTFLFFRSNRFNYFVKWNSESM